MTDQVDFWDSLAGKKEFTAPQPIDHIKEICGLNAKLLDYGCGYGRTLKALSEAGFTHLSGADFSNAMLALAGHQVPLGVDLRLVEHDRIPFSDEVFDGVLLLALLTCLPEPQAEQALLQELIRVLAPGGYVFVSDFLLADTEDRYTMQEDDYGVYGVFELPGGGVLKHHHVDRFKALWTGWQEMSFVQETFTTMNGNTANGVMAVYRKNLCGTS